MSADALKGGTGAGGLAGFLAPSEPTRARATAGIALALPGARGSLARERRRLHHLYETGNLLLAFEGGARTLAGVFDVMTKTLALRGAVLLYDEAGVLRHHAWPAHDAGALELAETHARHWYAYLAGAHPRPSFERTAAPAARGEPRPPARVPPGGGAGASADSWVTLPLATGRGRVFGALQATLAGGVDEASLRFIAAVVAQLAIALDRHGAARVAHEWAEAQRRQAEQRSDGFERRLARAERRRGVAEAVRERVEARLEFSRAVSDSVGEGVVAVDLAARVTFFNPAAGHLLGWTEGEALGAPVQELLRLQLPEGTLLKPEDCPLLHVLHTGEPARGDEIMFLGGDGVPFAVSYTSSPIRREGRLAGAVLVFQNVMALKRSENAQRFLAEVSAALAASLDAEQTLATAARLPVPRLADACRLEELAEDGGVTRVAFASGDRDPDGARRFEREPRWHEARAIALQTRRPQLTRDPPGPGGAGGGEGEPGFSSVMVAPLLARGRLLGLLSLSTLGAGRRYGPADLVFAEELAHRTAMALDNAHLYQQTQRAVQQRQDVLAVVSHDLRTPLGSILLGTTLLVNQSGELGESDARHQTLEIVTRSVAQMDRLLKDLLDMSSLEAGHFALDKAPHATDAIVDEAAEMLRPLAARRLVRLDAPAPREELVLPCDRGRIVQVLWNLVGNAIKFSPEGGTISVAAERRGPFAHFTVADEGPGISAERLPHVFERYWQASETATKGTGLGLYICKGIVEAHGGALGVESQVGRGSTFFFTLPLLPAVGGDAATAPAPAHAVAPDDEPPPRSSDRPLPPSLAFPSTTPNARR